MGRTGLARSFDAARTSISTSSGAMRAIASTGHAATHAGPSARPAQRSHLTAISADRSRRSPPASASERGRGAIWMLSQGHALAHAVQPVQRSSRMNTSPPGPRPMAPVGQSIMHAGCA